MGFIVDGTSQVNLDAVSTTAEFTPGELHFGSDGVYQYAKAEGAVSAGGLAIIDTSNDATAADTTGVGSVGQAIGAAVSVLADEEYGWFWRGMGSFEILVANAVSAGTQLTSTATGGTAGTGGVAYDGLRNIDAGVTATRVTCYCAGILTCGVAAAAD